MPKKHRSIKPDVAATNSGRTQWKIRYSQTYPSNEVVLIVSSIAPKSRAMLDARFVTEISHVAKPPCCWRGEAKSVIHIPVNVDCGTVSAVNNAPPKLNSHNDLPSKMLIRKHATTTTMAALRRRPCDDGKLDERLFSASATLI